MANHKKKSVGAYICLFDILTYHSHREKQTEKHPTLEYVNTVKCARRYTTFTTHYGEYILHSVAVTSAFVPVL